MPKFYADRRIDINGRVYNRGDMVFADRWQPGLRSENGEYEKAAAPIASTQPRRVDPSKFFGAPDPEITVIITFSNQADFVRDCIDSFRRQTVKVAYRIIAIIDQPLPDGTKEYLDKFPSIMVKCVDFGNAARSRQYGLSLVESTRWEHMVCFFDGDDIAYPEYLAKLRNTLVINPAADFSYARFDHPAYNPENGEIPRCNVYDWDSSVMQYSNITNTPIMIRCSALEHIRGLDMNLWDERLPIMQDFGMNVMLARAGKKGVHVREHLWRYRQTEKSIWQQGNVGPKKTAARHILAKPPYEVKTFAPNAKPSPVTFVSLISRSQVLDEYFSQIPALGIPSDVHWLIYIDSNREDLVHRVKSLAAEYQDRFRSLRIYVTNEQNLVDSKSFQFRGMRIARHIKSIMNLVSDQFLGTPYIFMVEDDTLAPKNTFPKLWDTMIKRKAAYVSGVEPGRGSTMHTGVCKLTEKNGEIVQRHIPLPKKKGIEKIGGGGWYCWIGKVSVIKKMEFRCDEERMLGPDVFMVHDLRARGAQCLVDWSVQCQHYDPKGGRWLKASQGRGYEIVYERGSDGKIQRLMTEIKR